VAIEYATDVTVDYRSVALSMESVLVRHIREAISNPYLDSSNSWVVLDEFPLDCYVKKKRGSPRIDVMVVSCRRGRRIERIAYEIKINRRDFALELRNPRKRERAYAICDYFYFAVPEGLIKKAQVPPECGLIEVSPDSLDPKVLKVPSWLKPTRVSSAFMADVLRRTLQVGRRLGAETCAFEGFDLTCEAAYMLMSDDDVPFGCRRTLVLEIADVLARMQRKPESRELIRIANGGKPDAGQNIPTHLGPIRTKQLDDAHKSDGRAITEDYIFDNFREYKELS
jgi:hypothetical protein